MYILILFYSNLGGRRRSSSASTSDNEKIEPAPLTRASTHSSTDDEGSRVILEGGIPAEVPLDALAGTSNIQAIFIIYTNI